ncbi:hypothetical protein CW368_05945 [Actinomycetales bacterium SN12]|nr:hypothetical protein CW368_05945 [Actinomycetales bacterium SN12]
MKKAESSLTTTLASDDVTRKQFPAVGLLGSGYDADAVDDLFDRVAAQLNRRGQNGQQTQVRAAQDARDEARLRGMFEDIKKNLGQRRDD